VLRAVRSFAFHCHTVRSATTVSRLICLLKAIFHSRRRTLCLERGGEYRPVVLFSESLCHEDISRQNGCVGTSWTVNANGAWTMVCRAANMFAGTSSATHLQNKRHHLSRCAVLCVYRRSISGSIFRGASVRAGCSLLPKRTPRAWRQNKKRHAPRTTPHAPPLHGIGQNISMAKRKGRKIAAWWRTAPACGDICSGIARWRALRASIAVIWTSAWARHEWRKRRVWTVWARWKEGRRTAWTASFTFMRLRRQQR